MPNRGASRVARAGGREGVTGLLRALAGQVKPTFMLPAVGMSAFGGLLAPTATLPALALHAAGVGLALYVAHLVDEYVDAHVRGEEPPTLSRRVLAITVILASACLLVVGLALVSAAGPLPALSLLPLWLLALLHATVLDRNTVAVTVDYPVGIALALLGGYVAQAGTVHPAAVALAVVFLALLAGVKVAVDRLDYEFDRRIGKRTVPVVLGDRRGGVAAAIVLVGAGALVVAFAAVGVLPRATAVAAPFPLAMAACCLRAGPRRAVRVAIALTYPFTAVLFLATCPATGCGAVRALVPFVFALTEPMFVVGYL